MHVVDTSAENEITTIRSENTETGEINVQYAKDGNYDASTYPSVVSGGSLEDLESANSDLADATSETSAARATQAGTAADYAQAAKETVAAFNVRNQKQAEVDAAQDDEAKAELEKREQEQQDAQEIADAAQTKNKLRNWKLKLKH